MLKTSLPLEYLVAEKLSGLKYGIQGEYHYLRPNEQGIPTEFSVDIWAVSPLIKRNIGMWANLNYLIECKYCSPGVKWLFAPHTKTDTEHLFERGLVHVLDKLCTKQIWDPRPLWRLSNHFTMCFKGVELHSRDATFQNIERGRSQLRYGAPRLAVHLIESQMMHFYDEELFIEFICPMLVTTAELYALKSGLKLDDFMSSDSLASISKKVPAIILTNPYSHLFSAFSDELLADLHTKKPAIKERLEQLSKLIKKMTGESSDSSKVPSSLWLDWDIREISQRILVVNYDSLLPIIKTLRSATVKAGRSLTRVGFLQKDLTKFKTWVVEHEEEENK